MASFDVHDKSGWYFGSMSRQDATDLLMQERESGVFLVRDSNSIIGDFVLCVREDSKVSHYIINKIIQTTTQQHPLSPMTAAAVAEHTISYRIGDQSFCDLPELLTFYKLHYLDTTPLRRPAQRKCEQVIGKFDFDGTDQDDLPFRRGEILTVISKDEDQWWTAKNSFGQIGQIPVPYVQKYTNNGQQQQQLQQQQQQHIHVHHMHNNNNNTNNTLERPGSGGSGSGILISGSNGSVLGAVHQICSSGGGGTVAPSLSLTANAVNPTTSAIPHMNHQHSSSPHQLGSALKKSDLNRKLPAYARVKQARVPNAYDKTALKLEINDIIKVTKTNINGQWEGELRGKKGHFPFTHVEFIDEDGQDDGTTSQSTANLNNTNNSSLTALSSSNQQIFTTSTTTTMPPTHLTQNKHHNNEQLWGVE